MTYNRASMLAALFVAWTVHSGDARASQVECTNDYEYSTARRIAAEELGRQGFDWFVDSPSRASADNIARQTLLANNLDAWLSSGVVPPGCAHRAYVEELKMQRELIEKARRILDGIDSFPRPPKLDANEL